MSILSHLLSARLPFLYTILLAVRYFLFFLTILAICTGVILYRYTNFINLVPDKQGNILSPLPGLLTKSFPKAIGDSGVWRPGKFISVSSGKTPEITAVSALSYDLTNDKILYLKNVNKRLPLASLTKIMTALVALENEDLKREITVEKIAASIGEDSMGLSEGESLTLEDLLYGLILNSGNDAAEAIAAASPFGRDNFVYLMNRKAEDLGLSDTHFTNPTGLEGDGKQYATAYDLLVLTEYALRNPRFAKIVSTYEYDIPQTSEHKEFHLYNETNLLTSYPGVKGVKTGFTNEAGLCLVTYLEYDGHRIIAVLLNAQNRRQEMKDLLDYSLKTLGVMPPPHG